MFLESEDDRNHRVAQQPALVQTLPTAVNSFTSSKKPLCSLPKNPPLPLVRSSHRTFSGICCCEPSQNSEQRGSASRNYDLLTLRTPAGGRFYTCAHARCAHMLAPAHAHYLANMRVTLTLRIQRGLIGAGGVGQAGFLPACCPPMGAGSAINTVVTGSSQHIVFLPHQKEEKKQLASPHIL